MAAIASMVLFFSPNVYAAAQTGTGVTEFGLLDLSLKIDPAVKDFNQDVSIELQDVNSERKYQYVFRYSQNYVIPDNPIKVIANTTYTVETYIRDTTGVSVTGADGRAVTQIEVTPDGAALALIVKSDTGGAEQTDAAQSPAQAGAEQNPAQAGAPGDLSSLIPVMDRFYEKTAYAQNGLMVANLNIWTKWTTNEQRFLREPEHTAEQWEGLSQYEKANYMALTIIPFETLFTYPTVKIDKRDKSSFMSPVLDSINYLKAASTDGGVYYDEICRVLDWEWDYYVQTTNFVDVIDEYAKLKAEGNSPANATNSKGADGEASGSANGSANGSAAGAVNGAAGGNAAGGANDAENTTTIPPGQPEAAADPNGALIITPAEVAQAAENNTPDQNGGEDVTKTVQKGLLDQILGNIIPIIIGLVLLLAFFLIKNRNERRKFQSDEKADGEN